MPGIMLIIPPYPPYPIPGPPVPPIPMPIPKPIIEVYGSKNAIAYLLLQYLLLFPPSVQVWILGCDAAGDR